VKLVVPALNAQFGVGAGRKRFLSACAIRALSNGMENPTLLVRRPKYVGGRA